MLSRVRRASAREREEVRNESETVKGWERERESETVCSAYVTETVEISRTCAVWLLQRGRLHQMGFFVVWWSPSVENIRLVVQTVALRTGRTWFQATEDRLGISTRSYSWAVLQDVLYCVYSAERNTPFTSSRVFNLHTTSTSSDRSWPQVERYHGPKRTSLHAQSSASHIFILTSTGFQVRTNCTDDHSSSL